MGNVWDMNKSVLWIIQQFFPWQALQGSCLPVTSHYDNFSLPSLCHFSGNIGKMTQNHHEKHLGKSFQQNSSLIGDMWLNLTQYLRIKIWAGKKANNHWHPLKGTGMTMRKTDQCDPPTSRRLNSLIHWSNKCLWSVCSMPDNPSRTCGICLSSCWNTTNNYSGWFSSKSVHFAFMPMK